MKLFRILLRHGVALTSDYLSLERPLLTLRILILPLACLTLFVLLSGCAQRETDIGSGAITGQPSDSFLVTTVTATASADFRPRVTNGYGPSLEVGEALGLYAYFALQFNLPAGLPDSVQLDTVRLRLRLNHIWPSSGVSGLRVRIREITIPWQEDSVLVDEFSVRDEFPGVDSLRVSTADSLFYWDVPRTVWQRWQAGDSTSTGLLFEPLETGSFFEFYSAEPRSIGATLQPVVQIRGTQWTEVDSVWQDTTLNIDLAATEDAYVVLDTTPRRPERVFVTQGMPERAAFYFPLDTLSSRFLREVNRAELHVFADTLDPYVIAYPGQNIIFTHGLLNDTSWIAHPTVADSFHMGYESGAVGTWDATNSEYILDVSGAVADWVANPSHNGGLQLIASDESSFLARQVFYSNLTDDVSKRPKLIIWYTEISY
jgi:hypothetical protein